MEHFEIDHIEVSDSNIDVIYWLSGHNESHSVAFKTRDFENWLHEQRKVSLSTYWDHWNPKVLDNLSNQMVLEDVKQYICFRFEMFQPAVEASVPSYVDKKPMTRVLGSQVSDLRSQV